MNKYRKIDKTTINKYIEKGVFKSVADFEAVREEYLKSDFYLKNRKRHWFYPSQIGLPLKKFKYLCEIELMIVELVNELQENASMMTQDQLNSRQEKLMDTVKLFPPPFDIYVTHSDACQIFGVSDERLKLYRESGILKSIKHKGVPTYPWTQLKELFD